MGQLKAHKDEAAQNTVKLKNHHKQMNVPFVVYPEFESLIRKIHSCAKEGQAMIKTEVHKPCSFSNVIVKSDGQTHRPFWYRRRDTESVTKAWSRQISETF